MKEVFFICVEDIEADVNLVGHEDLQGSELYVYEIRDASNCYYNLVIQDGEWVFTNITFDENLAYGEIDDEYDLFDVRDVIKMLDKEDVYIIKDLLSDE